MKIRSAIILIAIFSTTKIYSQISFGIKGGGSYVNNVEVTNNSNSDKFRFAYHFGVFTLFSLNEKWSISPELLYSDKGKKFEEGGILKLSYISLPILIYYELVDKLSLKLGPEVSHLLSAKYKVTGIGTPDAENFYKQKLDFGLVFGTSVNITKDIAIELRYIHGIKSVVDIDELVFGDGLGTQDPAFNPSDISFQNRTLQLSLVYNLIN